MSAQQLAKSTYLLAMKQFCFLQAVSNPTENGAYDLLV
jgi:hypothetical protein